ncbi:MAG: hypothetical protein LHW56_01630 [Candidatus Cloacimonetes bacterium]|nr:hypothetical protein [Candidatus Cloacimonadota bacterium]MDY0171588.1 hypothetical protein [Candidatus Cloacimonadaceae bacterium]
MFPVDEASWKGRQTSWAAKGDFTRKGYLSFPRDDVTRKHLTQLLGSSELAERMITQGFWELIISSYAERHADTASIQDVLADTFIVFSGGAEPIQVQFSGYVWVTNKEDHRLALLYMYEKLFRGSKLQATHPRLSMNLTLRDTTERFFPTVLQLSESALMQGATTFAMSGFACRYKILPSAASTPEQTNTAQSVDAVRSEATPTQKVLQANAATGSPENPGAPNSALAADPLQIKVIKV